MGIQLRFAEQTISAAGEHCLRGMSAKTSAVISNPRKKKKKTLPQFLNKFTKKKIIVCKFIYVAQDKIIHLEASVIDRRNAGQDHRSR